MKVQKELYTVRIPVHTQDGMDGTEQFKAQKDFKNMIS